MVYLHITYLQISRIYIILGGVSLTFLYLYFLLFAGRGKVVRYKERYKKDKNVYKNDMQYPFCTNFCPFCTNFCTFFKSIFVFFIPICVLFVIVLFAFSWTRDKKGSETPLYIIDIKLSRHLPKF